MKQRLISGIVVAAVAVTAILIGGYVLDILIILFGGIGIFEFYNAFSKRGYTPVKLFGAVYIALLVLMMYFDGDSYLTIIVHTKAHGAFNLFPPIFLLAMMVLLSLLVFCHEKYNAADAAITVCGGFYVIFFLSYFVKLRGLDGGAYLFFLALIGAVATDTFAYFIGKAIGKRKLIEAISPHKTVAGSIAGFAGNIAVLTIYGIVLWYTGAYQGLPLYHYPIIGAITGIVSQIGDLAASAIKRYAGIKDFGKIIPGHGGILDRIDSYLFAIPVVYYYLLFCGIGGAV
ncbi:MAG: phosphatidate cytidylyltransferase [Clostridia bacterium]